MPLRVASPLPLPCFTGDVQLPDERVAFSIVEVVINEQEVEASGSQRPVSVGQAWCDGNGMLWQKLAGDVRREHSVVFDAEDFHLSTSRVRGQRTHGSTL